MVALATIACRNDDAELRRREALAGEVAAQLRQHDIEGVSVALDGQVAVLSGLVASESQRLEAAQAARAVPGVLSVDNRLVVAQPPSLTQASDDARTTAAVQSQLASIGLRKLEVAVSDGAIVVSGPIARDRHDDAMRIVAASAPGYRVVDRTTPHP